MKTCPSCITEKPDSEFYKNSRRGRQSWCSQCVLIAQKDRWKARKKAAVLLLGGCCSMCGYKKNIGALDFHHRNPEEKEFNWSQNRKHNWQQVIAELKKCVVLCRNCHAELHYPHLAFDRIDEFAANKSLLAKAENLVATGKCKQCDNEVFGTIFCSRECRSKGDRRVSRPPIEQLLEMKKTMTFVDMGKKFGVSDNAIRKWLNMNKQELINSLARGETVKYREKGNSMLPIIQSGALLTVTPVNIDDLKENDVVFCRVKGRLVTHLVTAKNDVRGVQISNNNGHVNGWTKTVFGKVVKIEA